MAAWRAVYYKKVLWYSDDKDFSNFNIAIMAVLYEKIPKIKIRDSLQFSFLIQANLNI